MKQWGSALFPLSVLFVLAALTFWLRYVTEMPEPRRDGKYRHDPDYIVSDSTLRKIDPTGRLQYTLQSAEIRHYPDDDSTEMTRPNIRHLYPKRPPLTMSADHGWVSKDGEQVNLIGNVRIHREGSAKEPPMTATMPDLTAFPDDERAFTRSPVLITRGNSWLKGIGLQVDQRNQTYVLESQAKASLESKHARKK